MRFAPLLLVIALCSVLLAPGTIATAPAATPAPTAPTAGGGSVSAENGPADGGPSADPAAIADSIAASSSTTANLSEQSRVLVVPDPAVRMTAIRRATLDLGPATEFSGNISAVRMENAAVRTYVQAGDDETARQTRIKQAIRELERETNTLREQRQAAIRDYNRETISTRTFVVQLATIGAKAAALEKRVTMLKSEARGIDGWTDGDRNRVKSRLESVRYQLRALGGPVSDRAAAAVRGTAPPTRVFVTTGPEGYELTAIVNDTYVREAFRGTFRQNDPSTPVEASESSLIEVFRQSYPVLTERWGEPSGEGSGTTFVLTSDGEGGNVTAFVDSASEKVFKESQYHSLDSVRASGTATNVQNGLQMTVNRSYPGGPVRVNVTDVETGDPVNATITLSQNGRRGESAGRTGDDGVLWTLSPRGEYSVSAVNSATSVVVVETNSTEPPAIN